MTDASVGVLVLMATSREHVIHYGALQKLVI